MISEVKLIQFPFVEDDRGILTAIEGNSTIPFAIQRIFYIHGIQSERGGHAHSDTDQVLIAMHGSFRVKLFDGKDSVNYFLNNPNEGLFIPKLIYIEMDAFSKDSIGLVLANTNYDIKKSLRSKEEYLKFIQ